MASHFNVNPERWREWAVFRHELGEDTYAARAQVSHFGSSQLNRRTFVRALFAEIEGTINYLKNDALDTQSSLFNPAELAMLRDETYGVDGQGNAHTQPKFVRIENNLLFALRSYLRYYGAELRINKGGAEWAAFRATTVVRHRLTHPRRVEELSVTDTELTDAVLTHDWFAFLIWDHQQRAAEALISVLRDVASKRRDAQVDEALRRWDESQPERETLLARLRSRHGEG